MSKVQCPKSNVQVSPKSNVQSPKSVSSNLTCEMIEVCFHGLWTLDIGLWTRKGIGLWPSKVCYIACGSYINFNPEVRIWIPETKPFPAAPRLSPAPRVALAVLSPWNSRVAGE